MPPVPPQGPQGPTPQGPQGPGSTPVTPQVPTVGAQDVVAGQAQNAQARLTAAQKRQQALQRMAEQKNPLFRRVYFKTIQAGALVNFNYTFWKHDPYPLILCAGIWPSGKVVGVNLHYMTFKYIRYLIQMYCGKAFSYQLIKNNTFIYNSFRSYKRDGIRMSKLLDCEFLMTLLGTVRSFSPNEIKAIREEVQRQLRARMNPSVDDATDEYTGMVVPNPNAAHYSNVAGYNPLDRYGEPVWPNAVPKLAGPKPTLADRRTKPDMLQPPPTQ